MYFEQNGYFLDETQEKDDATALKDFLLDIQCLDPLAEWTNTFNLFDILKLTRVEIRHSNMLAWLLNPNENHGFGDGVLRGFIQYIVSSFSYNDDIIDMLLMDCHSFIIQREWHNIDIIAFSPNENFLLCIENKIDSSEHDNQLDRYRKIVEHIYPEYKKIYIYLSPDGTEASDSENWCSMSYENVLEIVEGLRSKTKLLPDAQLLIDNYIDTIRRNIVGDEKLAQICAEIYAKHQKALDLIFENRPDRTSAVAEIIKDWAAKMTQKGELEFVPEKSSKFLIRYKTKKMSEILPDANESTSAWGTKNYYFYEIRNKDGLEVYFQFDLNGKNIPDDLRKICDHLNMINPSKINKENWQWRTLYKTRKFKVDDELTQETISEQLLKRFEDIKSFETKLIATYKSETNTNQANNI